MIPLKDRKKKVSSALFKFVHASLKEYEDHVNEYLQQTNSSADDHMAIDVDREDEESNHGTSGEVAQRARVPKKAGTTTRHGTGRPQDDSSERTSPPRSTIATDRPEEPDGDTDCLGQTPGDGEGMDAESDEEDSGENDVLEAKTTRKENTRSKPTARRSTAPYRALNFLDIPIAREGGIDM